MRRLFRGTGRRKPLARFSGHEGRTAVHRGMHSARRSTKKAWPSTAAQQVASRNVTSHSATGCRLLRPRGWGCSRAWDCSRGWGCSRATVSPLKSPSRAGFVQLFVSILLLHLSPILTSSDEEMEVFSMRTSTLS